MTSAQERLAMIGCGAECRDPPCWRTERLATIRAGECRAGVAPDPAHSRALALWRNLLARDPRPSPYRISRA